MCCSASDLYLSLVIFSNAALDFVFAEFLRCHLKSDSLFQPLFIPSCGLQCYFFHPSVKYTFLSLLSRLKHFKIVFTDAGKAN